MFYGLDFTECRPTLTPIDWCIQVKQTQNRSTYYFDINNIQTLGMDVPKPPVHSWSGIGNPLRSKELRMTEALLSHSLWMSSRGLSCLHKPMLSKDRLLRRHNTHYNVNQSEGFSFFEKIFFFSLLLANFTYWKHPRTLGLLLRFVMILWLLLQVNITLHYIASDKSLLLSAATVGFSVFFDNDWATSCGLYLRG